MKLSDKCEFYPVRPRAKTRGRCGIYTLQEHKSQVIITIMKKNIVLCILSLLLMSGCSEEKTEDKATEVVEYMTGAQHIKAYERTKSKLDDINKTLEERNEGID